MKTNKTRKHIKNFRFLFLESYSSTHNASHHNFYEIPLELFHSFHNLDTISQSLFHLFHHFFIAYFMTTVGRRTSRNRRRKERRNGRRNKRNGRRKEGAFSCRCDKCDKHLFNIPCKVQKPSRRYTMYSNVTM